MRLSIILKVVEDQFLDFPQSRLACLIFDCRILDLNLR